MIDKDLREAGLTKVVTLNVSVYLASGVWWSRPTGFAVSQVEPVRRLCGTTELQGLQSLEKEEPDHASWKLHQQKPPTS